MNPMNKVTILRIILFFLFGKGLLMVSAGANSKKETKQAIIRIICIVVFGCSVVKRNGTPEKSIVDTRRQSLLVPAWKPKPVNLKILKNTKTKMVSFKTPRRKDIKKIIMSLLKVK